MEHKKRLKGSIIGLAIGDAMGAPVEFQKRGTFIPVTDYRSGGIFSLNAGDWTDDTAMALCIAQSLIDVQGFSSIDQMEKYLAWMNHGYMSCSGKMIGIGKTARRTLIRYMRTREPYTDIIHEKFSGNGSLMRLAPICVYYAHDLDKAIHYAALSSKTTHASPIAVDSCRYFAYILIHIFKGYNKKTIFSKQFSDSLNRFFYDKTLHPTLSPIINVDFKTKTAKEISSSGYVIDSLEAALWSFYHTDSFEDAILTAVNLGDDADTVAAITGQLAGAYYMLNSIPKPWIEELAQSEFINNLSEELINTK